MPAPDPPFCLSPRTWAEPMYALDSLEIEAKSWVPCSDVDSVAWAVDSVVENGAPRGASMDIELLTGGVQQISEGWRSF